MHSSRSGLSIIGTGSHCYEKKIGPKLELRHMLDLIQWKLVGINCTCVDILFPMAETIYRLKVCKMLRPSPTCVDVFKTVNIFGTKPADEQKTSNSRKKHRSVIRCPLPMLKPKTESTACRKKTQ